MCQEILYWLVGLVVATVGGMPIGLLLKRTRKRLGITKSEDDKDKQLSPLLTGVVERFVFAIFVGLNIQGIAPGMMAWLGLKLAANWNRTKGDNQEQKSLSLTAALAGLVSMMFAAIGGMICRGFKS
ncbi:MAG TPA: hypothetical protein VHP35_04135 [Terriglobia bacterium]|nr:hypothetical protein [Terriglobia bacterium]